MNLTTASKPAAMCCTLMIQYACNILTDRYVGYLMALYQMRMLHSVEKENHGNPQLGQSEIRTECTQNTSVQSYRYTRFSVYDTPLWKQCTQHTQSDNKGKLVNFIMRL